MSPDDLTVSSGESLLAKPVAVPRVAGGGAEADGLPLALLGDRPEAEGSTVLFPPGAAELLRLIGGWSIPVVLLDRDGVVRGWNRGATRLYERAEGEALGQPWKSLVGEPEDLAPLPTPGTRTRRYEAVHRTSDGSSLDVIVTRTELVSDDGTVGGSVALVIDLTESKALERRLARRLAQLSVIREIGEALQSATEASVILRTILVGATAGQGLQFNRAFLLLVDEKRGELRGRLAIGPADPGEAGRIWSEMSVTDTSLRALLRKYEPYLERANSRVNQIARSLVSRLDDHDAFLIRALEGKATVRVREGIAEPPGEPVDPALIAKLEVDDFVLVPLVAEGKTVGLLLADNAITGRPIEDEDVGVLEFLGMQAAVAIERARLTEALATQVASLEQATREIRANQERLLRAERLSAVGEMAARVAHEIRNPLVAIGGFALFLQRNTPPEDPRKEAISVIVDEVRRLEGIVREVLDYSRPSPPRIGRLDVRKLAQDALELLTFELDEASVQGTLEAEENLSAGAADRDQLFQALVNVMRNAVHAMPAGGRLTLRLRSLPGGVEIAVEDTGIGMPPEVRARVFEPFFTTKSTGSGLGLTIASQIVRDHRGEILVDSQPGQGTTILMRIPAAEEELEHGEDTGD